MVKANQKGRNIVAFKFLGSHVTSFDTRQNILISHIFLIVFRYTAPASRQEFLREGKVSAD